MSDPANPLIGGYYDKPLGHIPNNVAVAGGYVFAASESSGLEVYQFYGTGVEESPRPQALSRKPKAKTLYGTSTLDLDACCALFDAMGRRVANPRSGIYFVSEEPQATSPKPQARTIRKVVIQK